MFTNLKLDLRIDIRQLQQRNSTHWGYYLKNMVAGSVFPIDPSCTHDLPQTPTLDQQLVGVVCSLLVDNSSADGRDALNNNVGEDFLELLDHRVEGLRRLGRLVLRTSRWWVYLEGYISIVVL